MSDEGLKPCPFCNGEMQLRQALWPHDGDTDSIIHKDIQGGPDGCCGMSDFSIGTADEGQTVLQAWNRRTDIALSALREAREGAERRASAARGQVTKLKNRAAAGVCPCCNRQFQNLKNHMATKHPEFNAPENLKVIEGGRVA